MWGWSLLVQGPRSQIDSKLCLSTIVQLFCKVANFLFQELSCFFRKIFIDWFEQFLSSGTSPGPTKDVILSRCLYFSKTIMFWSNMVKKFCCLADSSDQIINHLNFHISNILIHKWQFCFNVFVFVTIAFWVKGQLVDNIHSQGSRTLLLPKLVSRLVDVYCFTVDQVYIHRLDEAKSATFTTFE